VFFNADFHKARRARLVAGRWWRTGTIRNVGRGREFEFRRPVSSESTRGETLDDIIRLVRGKGKCLATAVGGALPLPNPVITLHIYIISYRVECHNFMLFPSSNSLSFLMTAFVFSPLGPRCFPRLCNLDIPYALRGRCQKAAKGPFRMMSPRARVPS
jgi:hypothetical protein